MSLRLLIGTVLVTSCGVSAQLGTAAGSLTPAKRSSGARAQPTNSIAAYVFEETGRKMAARLREQLGAGAYDSIVDRQAFADALTRDVRALNADGHLRIVTKGARHRRVAVRDPVTSVRRRSRRLNISTAKSVT